MSNRHILHKTLIYSSFVIIKFAQNIQGICIHVTACCILKSVTALPSYERFGIAGLDHNHFLKLRHRPCCRPPVVYLGIIKTFQEIIKNPPTLKFNNCELRQKFMSFSFRAYFTNCLRLKEKCSGSQGMFQSSLEKINILLVA